MLPALVTTLRAGLSAVLRPFPQWLRSAALATLATVGLLPVLLVAEVLTDPPVSAPPITAVAPVRGYLHFTGGARDWSTAELRLGHGKVLPLRCRRYLAQDACFSLAQAESLEGHPATVWQDPLAGTLQIEAGGSAVVSYQQSRSRLSEHPYTVALLVSASCAVALLAMLLALGRRAQRHGAGPNNSSKPTPLRGAA